MRRRNFRDTRYKLYKRKKVRLRHRLEVVLFLVLVILIALYMDYNFKSPDKNSVDTPRKRIKYLERTDNMDKSDDWSLILVNSRNPVPSDYSVRLEKVQNNHYVDSRIAAYVNEMIRNAEKDGVKLLICSSYRTVARQQELFDQQVDEYISAGKSYDEALAETATGLALPGFSEHNTGLALDIVTPSYQILDSNFENTEAFRWLDKNAHKYGFILRYPKDKSNITRIKYEPWHYRYVGVEHAAVIKEKGLCLEEYLEELQ